MTIAQTIFLVCFIAAIATPLFVILSQIRDANRAQCVLLRKILDQARDEVSS